MGFLRQLFDQMNMFDGGKTFNNPQPQRPQQLQRLQQMQRPLSRITGTAVAPQIASTAVAPQQETVDNRMTNRMVQQMQRPLSRIASTVVAPQQETVDNRMTNRTGMRFGAGAIEGNRMVQQGQLPSWQLENMPQHQGPFYDDNPRKFLGF